MPIETISQVKSRIKETPANQSCQFHLGQRVSFTNDNGVKFPGYRIIGFDAGDHSCFQYGNHIYLDKDSYWYPVREDQLSPE